MSAVNHPYRPRSVRWALGIAALGLALAGCGNGDTGPSASASASSPATGSPEAPSGSEAPTSSASASATDGEPTDEAEPGSGLPSAELEQNAYEGEPRPLDEVYHVACLEALAGDEELPETEGSDEDADGDVQLRPWSVQNNVSLTEGWRYCPTAIGGGIAIPSAFGVAAEAEDGAATRLQISDAQGNPLGGVERDVSGGAPEGAEVVEVLEMEEQPVSPDRAGETTYLRSMVVKAGSGVQLMVDLVSAPADADPESLEVWDLAVHGGEQRDVVYASMPLDSAEDAEQATASDLHRVLRSMVGSYTSPVQ